MLVDFKVSNFLSIKDEVCLDLKKRSSSSNLKENFFKINNEELLNSCVIYGGNATGKSNIIKAFDFMFRMILNSQNHQFGAKLNLSPYMMDDKMKKKPSSFEITFLLDSLKYTYGFSATKDKIVKEYLYSISGKGAPKKYFERGKANDFNFTRNESKQKRIAEDTNDNQLYFSKIALHNYEELKDVYSFFQKRIIININPTWNDYTINKIHKDKEFKKWAINILKKGDFGGIQNLKTELKERPIKEFSFHLGKETSVEVMEDKKQEVIEMKFIHKDTNGNDLEFNDSQESIGTLKTIAMLGPIYDALKLGRIVCIDEFEINLHPEITKFLTKLFHSSHNEKNGQIIFTTHDSSLLRVKDLFRRDQVYFTEKAPNKNTELVSLMDYEVREGIDFQNAYLSGRVGGLPFVDESFF